MTNPHSIFSCPLLFCVSSNISLLSTPPWSQPIPWSPVHNWYPWSLASHNMLKRQMHECTKSRCRVILKSYPWYSVGVGLILMALNLSQQLPSRRFLWVLESNYFGVLLNLFKGLEIYPWSRKLCKSFGNNVLYEIILVLVEIPVTLCPHMDNLVYVILLSRRQS